MTLKEALKKPIKNYFINGRPVLSLEVSPKSNTVKVTFKGGPTFYIPDYLEITETPTTYNPRFYENVKWN